LALEKVQAVATHVDVHNQRVQNIAKMMEIQRALVTGKVPYQPFKKKKKKQKRKKKRLTFSYTSTNLR